MAAKRLIAWVERGAWILVYGGLFAMLLGWVSRRDAATTGALLLGAGGLALVAGIVLVGIRARLREPMANRSVDTQGKT
jgi:hypothetical protein